ncbi:hypothetical protein I4F81_001900 [Pyropia yezoensis]|uniref:Uncharacterized protein n=1 Tax=Pyropia yezoensis TaxID=2788 RepID=A0ACC3BNV9_PYRYE|nr:hypothetical protein I4F81_001900 [Neopyropia yezoensis]
MALFSSPLPPLPSPSPTPASLPATVLAPGPQDTLATADTPALIDASTGRTLTYAALRGRVAAAAAGATARLGLAKGDVALLMGPNDVDWVVAAHAVVAAGGVVSPAGARGTVGEVERQLRAGGAVAVFVGVDCLPVVRAVVAQRAAQRRRGGEEDDSVAAAAVVAPRVGGDALVIVVLDGNEGDGAWRATPGHDGFLSFSDLVDAGIPLAAAAAAASAAAGDGGAPAPALSPVPIDAAMDVAALPFSSGTTGISKGVVLTHANLIANVRQLDAHAQAAATAAKADGAGGDDGGVGGGGSGRCAAPPATPERDTVLAVLPLSHIYGFSLFCCHCLHVRSTVVLLRAFALPDFLTAIASHRVSLVYVVPPLVAALAAHPLVASFNLSSLRRMVCGAAPLPDSTARAATARLGVPITQGFGLTETSPVTHLAPPGAGTSLDAAADLLGCIGVPVASTECKVVDMETGEPLPAGAEGELCIRGPQVMRGYLAEPPPPRASTPADAAEPSPATDATAAAALPRRALTLNTRCIDADGFFHTGDLVTVRPDGVFRVVGRAKELIKYKGVAVPPAEVEAVLLDHPSIVDTAVVGVPDGEAGELPRAYIVLAPGAVLSPADVAAWVHARVSPHKRLRGGVVAVAAIPKSPAGKVLRRLLVQESALKL